MKKANQPLQNAAEFFAQLKQYLKAKSTRYLRMQKLKQYSHSNNQQQTSLSKLMQYIHLKTRFDKQKSNEQCGAELNKIICQDRTASEKFKADSDGLVYISKYAKIMDEKLLLQEIQNTPQGLFVDDQLLRFKQYDQADLRDSIQLLVHTRQILPVKSKFVEKAKIKDNNYQGYILFPFPPQIKQISSNLFKPLGTVTQLEKQLEKDREDRQAKIAKIYVTKISNYRKQFSTVCQANISKGQDKSSQNQNREGFQKIFQTWDQKNKKSIPNFEREAQQWFKNRK